MPAQSTASPTPENKLQASRTAVLALALFASTAAPAATPKEPKETPAATSSASRLASPGVSAASGSALYAERFRNTCAACHGASGRSDLAGVPVLAGQHSLYTITQLFLFREGRRANESMVALAKGMSDADLRGFSDYIGTLPPVPAPAPPTAPDAARMTKGQALAQQHKCVYCHGATLDGGQGVPRIGGQKEDYLLSALQGYKSGTRPGYTRAMSEALSQVPAEDLDLLAFYVANFISK